MYLLIALVLKSMVFFLFPFMDYIIFSSSIEKLRHFSPKTISEQLTQMSQTLRLSIDLHEYLYIGSKFWNFFVMIYFFFSPAEADNISILTSFSRKLHGLVIAEILKNWYQEDRTNAFIWWIDVADVCLI